jgi:hypothetical protein
MPSSAPGSKPSVLAEVVTAPTVEAVNAALAERGVDAAAVVAVILVTGTPLADGPGERFRVLYRS